MALQDLLANAQLAGKRFFFYFDDVYVYHVTGHVPNVGPTAGEHCLAYRGSCRAGARVVFTRQDAAASGVLSLTDGEFSITGVFCKAEEKTAYVSCLDGLRDDVDV